jgi:coproporphyrinogen III oxidase
MTDPNRQQIADAFRTIQADICQNLEQLDGKEKFSNDTWKHQEGGGGHSRVIQHGNMIEKGGVNFSEVWGTLPEPLKKEFGDSVKEFFATGVSIVLHPYSPHVPIIHMNIRYFETDSGRKWFGGGIDLTPHYIDAGLAKKFHTQLKNVCDKHSPEYYNKFKTWADDYFFIPHRNETRGIGGIFFDHLTPAEGQNWQQLFDFVCAVGRTFYPAYEEQVLATREKPAGEAQKKWQQLRRGRYVEFNLVYDRGTKFGLQTNGRIESILMSLPETAGWLYNYQPAEGSPEQMTLQHLKKGVDWLK